MNGDIFWYLFLLYLFLLIWGSFWMYFLIYILKNKKYNMEIKLKYDNVLWEDIKWYFTLNPIKDIKIKFICIKIIWKIDLSWEDGTIYYRIYELKQKLDLPSIIYAKEKIKIDFNFSWKEIEKQIVEYCNEKKITFDEIFNYSYFDSEIIIYIKPTNWLDNKKSKYFNLNYYLTP